MALRWTLGLFALLAGGGWVLVAVLGHGFRESFGASPIGLAQVALPPLAMLLVLVSVFAPSSRPLLHVASAAVALLAIACLFVLRESLFVGGLGLGFCALWGLFYVQSAWR